MSSAWIRIRGEPYVTLEAVAECYEVELGWVVEVYETGLLGEGERADGSPAIPVVMLDRVAEIHRLQRHLGLDLVAVELWIRTTG